MRPDTLDLLLIYDDLTPGERQQADAYLREQPEAWAIVEEGRDLKRLLEECSKRASSGNEDPGLLDLEQMGGTSGAESGRIEEILSFLPDPRAHLAALLSEETASNGRAADRPAMPGSIPAADRTKRIASRRFRTSLVFAATIFFVAAALLFSSEQSIQTHERVAALSELPASFPEIRLRNDAPDLFGAATRSYSAGLESVRAARSSFLGLFPDYGSEHLHLALHHFDAAIEADVEGPVGLEAAYARARVLVYLERFDEAADHLRTVIERGGVRTPESITLLEVLERRGLIQHS